MRTQWHCFFGGIFMSKFDKRKIAVALAFASLGSKTLAMSSNKNQVKSLKTLGAVGGRLIIMTLEELKKALQYWKKF